VAGERRFLSPLPTSFSVFLSYFRFVCFVHFVQPKLRRNGAGWKGRTCIKKKEKKILVNIKENQKQNGNENKTKKHT
jgi:hypothetical protein